MNGVAWLILRAVHIIAHSSVAPVGQPNGMMMTTLPCRGVEITHNVATASQHSEKRVL